MPIVYNPTSFTGQVYNQTPFDVSFGSTFSNYTKTIQFTDSSPAVVAATSGNRFVSTTGYTGTGNVGTLIVDAISTNPRTVNTYAGSGISGYLDGPASNARFNYPRGMTVDPDGVLYVADNYNYMIRKIDTDGTVTRFAGTGVSRKTDGPLATCEFKDPYDIDVDINQNWYIGDQFTVRKVSNGIVTTVTGSTTSGYTDANGTNARFSNLYSLAAHPDGSVYVGDYWNNAIRKIDVCGNVGTVVGPGSGIDGSAGFIVPFANPFGVLSSNSSNVRLFDLSSTSMTTYPNTPGFDLLNGIAQRASDGLIIVVGSGSGGMASNAFVTTPSSFPTSGSWLEVIDPPLERIIPLNAVALNDASDCVVVGDQFMFGTSSVAYMTDLTANSVSPTSIFTPVTGTSVLMSSGRAVAYGAGVWVVTGVPGTHSIITSSTLTGWTGRSSSTLIGTGRSVTTDGSSNWIVMGTAGGGSEPYRYSTDNGVTWSRISALESISGVAFVGTQVLYANGLWVAVGGDAILGTGTIAYSSNLTSWTNTGQTVIESNVTSITYNSNTSTWLARGVNSLNSIQYAKSTDGTSWSSFSTPSGDIEASDRKVFSINAPSFYTQQSLVATTTTPYGLKADPSGTIYFLDATNRVRKISNGVVSTVAGTGAAGSKDGDVSNATFQYTGSLDIDPLDGSIYVQQGFLDPITRVISNGQVSRYAGRSGVVASVNGDALIEAAFSNPAKIVVSGSNLYVAQPGTNQIRVIRPPVPSARPGGTVPSGYTIVETSNFPIVVSSRIDGSTNPGDIVNVYKYEPFSYGYTLRPEVSAGDTLSYSRSSTELIQFLSNVNSRTISFSSVNGPTAASSNALSLIIDDVSGGLIMETLSNTVYVNSGRFFPPANNSVYTFYRNEPIDPVQFKATISLSNPVSFPALPPGLSFTRVASNEFNLTGTPLVQQLSSNYRILANGLSNSAQVVSVLTNMRVLGERVILNTSGSTLIQGVSTDVSISPVLVTARCPPYPVLASNVRYTWSPALPSGIQFTDLCGTPVSSGFVVTDLSYSIQLQGAPTVAALQTTSSPYTVTLTATRQTTPAISSNVSFTFAFQETVVFDPFTITPQYVGAAVQSSSTSNSFSASTRFSTTSVPITTIFSPDLRSDLSLSFVYSTQRASLTGTPTSTGSNTYTIRAINVNNVSADTTATISVSNDQVFFSIPTTDICYNFILQRPLSSAKTGYYTSPIQFRASTLSGCNVTMTTNDLSGTGISLIQTDTNLYDLSGTPSSTRSLTTLTVTASSPATSVSNNATARYAILADTYTFNNPVLAFVQNVAITPVQFTATSLSGRAVVRYTSPDVPSGLTLSPTGLLTGTPLIGSNGSFTVIASTVYTSDSRVYSYTVVPDSVLLFTDETSYTTAAGVPVSIPVHSVTYSGTSVTSFDLSGLSPTYGLSIDGSGVISGIVSTSIPSSTPFTVLGYAGSSVGSLAASLVSANPSVSSTLIFSSPFTGGPTLVSPLQTSFIYYQYMTIQPIVFSASGSGTVYISLNSSDLPLGLSWNPLTQKITGSPMRTGETVVTVYLSDTTGVRRVTLKFTVLIPRIIRQQDGAGAFTSLVRQYVEVNAAQNARDSRVFPTQERALGEFMSPEAPDVTTPDQCKKC